jgi:carboxypeptidase D
MTWNGKLGFESMPNKPINISIPDLVYANAFQAQSLTGFDGPQGIMGIQHYERGLMWAETFQSGHMQPQFQPRVAYRHLEWLLGRTEEI